MPRSTQDFLIHVLLLWLTVLSIIQATFIIFFFVAGHHSPVSPLQFPFTLQLRMTAPGQQRDRKLTLRSCPC